MEDKPVRLLDDMRDVSTSVDGSLRIRGIACPAMGGPHTRKASIKEFHQFAMLTVTIPLDIRGVFCLLFS